jgi:hypothetical protein
LPKAAYFSLAFRSFRSKVSIAESIAVQEHISRKSFFQRILAAGAAFFGGSILVGAAGREGGSPANSSVAAKPEPRSIPRDIPDS